MTVVSSAIISSPIQHLADGQRVLDTRKIKRRRIALRLSQADAAKRAGLTGRQHWSLIEKGKAKNITLETLGAIARALQVKPRSLLK
jgi:transcriptional regulator with XRE-family HTH domain